MPAVSGPSFAHRLLIAPACGNFGRNWIATRKGTVRVNPMAHCALLAPPHAAGNLSPDFS